MIERAAKESIFWLWNL